MLGVHEHFSFKTELRLLYKKGEQPNHAHLLAGWLLVNLSAITEYNCMNKKEKSEAIEFFIVAPR